MKALTIKEAAALMDVSPRSVKSAGVVLRRGNDTLTWMVEDGRVSIRAAEYMARNFADGAIEEVNSVKDIATIKRLVSMLRKVQICPSDNDGGAA